MRPPAKTSSPFVRSLLGELEERGFAAAPRYLGVDEQGRETFTYLDGAVLDELDAGHDDATLMAAGRLIRYYQDATAGSALAGDKEVVRHNYLSPCNFVSLN